MREDDRKRDFKTGRPVPEKNPTGIIEGATGRLFSRLDVEFLDRVDREALKEEVARFLALNPEHYSALMSASWLRTTGPGTDSFEALFRFEPDFARDAGRLLRTTFYDRLERWLTREDHAALGTAPVDDSGLPVTPATQRAFAVARRLARRAVPEAWLKARALREESARAWAEMVEQDRKTARAFAATHAAHLSPTSADLDTLAQRLTAKILEKETESELEAAALTNPLLRNAMAAFEAWQARINELTTSGRLDELALEAKQQRAVTFTRTFAYHWPAALHAWELENAPRLGVDRAVRTLVSAAHDAAERGAPRLREVVAEELSRPEFVDATGWPWPVRHEETEADGMAAPRARLLGYLRHRFCPKGTGPALEWLTDLENRGRAALAEWKSQERMEGVESPSPWQVLTPSLAASLVAQVVWLDRVAGETRRANGSSPALVAKVHADVGMIFRASENQHALALGGPGLPWVMVDSEEDAARLLGAGSTLTFQRLIRFLPTVAHESWIQTHRDEADVVIEGGYAALAENIGAKSKKAAAEVRDALMLGSHVRREWADGSEAQGLWTFHATPAAPGRPAKLVVTLAAALRPGFVHDLPKGPAKTLVPVVPLPALVGSRVHHAAQAALQWEVTRRLAEGRKQAASEGGVLISPADFKRMMDRVGLPGHMLATMLEAWTAGDAPFLENVRGDLWTIADSAPFAPARAWLHDQATLSGHGRKRGLKAAAKRRGKTKSAKP
jgi:hypothetical protein